MLLLLGDEEKGTPPFLALEGEKANILTVVRKAFEDRKK